MMNLSAMPFKKEIDFYESGVAHGYLPEVQDC
jgi:hypothetical protein